MAGGRRPEASLSLDSFPPRRSVDCVLTPRRPLPQASPHAAHPFWTSLRPLVLNFLVPIAVGWALVASIKLRFDPGDPAKVGQVNEAFGPYTVFLKLPGTSAGIEEPVLSSGRAGNASLVFIRLLPHAQARIGVEFWGRGSFQSEPFALSDPEATIAVKLSLPAFYPPGGDKAWGEVSLAEQQYLAGHYVIAVDGVVRLSGATDYREAPHAPLFFGANPLGGSFVADRFSGQVVRVEMPHGP